jgi:CheY-like chemotaxis protein
VRTAAEALAAFERERYDCIILDLGLPDMPGDELIARVRSNPSGAGIPVIVYTGRDLTHQEEARLAELSEAVIVKDAMSPERLVEETRFFLHQVRAHLPASKRAPIDLVRDAGAPLALKRVLIVDDDARNIFALRSALELHGMEVASAESGREGIELLARLPRFDVVLMDIMMPEMDGYETIRRIRAEARFADLPIIALTAKAMKGDRESCIAAGASEYISKPVDVEQLLPLIRECLDR